MHTRACRLFGIKLLTTAPALARIRIIDLAGQPFVAQLRLSHAAISTHYNTCSYSYDHYNDFNNSVRCVAATFTENQSVEMWYYFSATSFQLLSTCAARQML